MRVQPWAKVVLAVSIGAVIWLLIGDAADERKRQTDRVAEEGKILATIVAELDTESKRLELLGRKLASRAASELEELTSRLDARERREADARTESSSPDENGAGEASDSMNEGAFDDWVLETLLALRTEEGAWTAGEPSEVGDDEEAEVESRVSVLADLGLLGLGVCFERDAFGGRLFSVNCLAGNGEVRHVEDDYDYTATNGEDRAKAGWYHEAIASKTGIWQVYYGASSKQKLVEFACPIRPDGRADGEPIGVAFVYWGYEQLKSHFVKVHVGGTSEAFVVRPDGQFVYGALESWFRDDRRIQDMEADLGIGEGLAAAILENSSGRVRSNRSGEPDVVWSSTRTDWRVVLSVRDDLPTASVRYRTSRPLINLSLVLALIAFAIIVFHGQGRNEWDVAMAATAVFVVGTGHLWSLAYMHETLSPPTADDGRSMITESHVRITDESDVDERRRKYEEIARSRDEVPTFVRTGIFVQSARFITANDVHVTGYVWQRIPVDAYGLPAAIDVVAESIELNTEGIPIAADDRGPRLEPGVVFPESEDTTFVPAYEIRQGSEHVYGWYFTASLRQPFSHRDYPFEREEVWIRIWDKNFFQNVILIPDLEAYDRTTAASLPGVEVDLVLPGWRLRQSYFAIPSNSYNTNFGIDDFRGQHDNPELYFNIQIQRQFVSPFISHLIPMFVILITLFILLCLSEKEASEHFGFNSVAVIATVVGIFFVVIFQHIALRRALEAERFVYLELIYFLTYLYLLLVIVNAVITVMDIDREHELAERTWFGSLMFWPIALGRKAMLDVARFMNRGGNETIRTLYWPLYTGLVWALTLTMTLLASG